MMHKKSFSELIGGNLAWRTSLQLKSISSYIFGSNYFIFFAGGFSGAAGGQIFDIRSTS